MMHLTGGVGEASFQQAGYSRPNSDCEGTKFTQPANDQSRISGVAIFVQVKIVQVDFCPSEDCPSEHCPSDIIVQVTLLSK